VFFLVALSKTQMSSITSTLLLYTALPAGAAAYYGFSQYKDKHAKMNPKYDDVVYGAFFGDAFVGVILGLGALSLTAQNDSSLFIGAAVSALGTYFVGPMVVSVKDKNKVYTIEAFMGKL
jgi:hypothetical protein